MFFLRSGLIKPIQFTKLSMTKSVGSFPYGYDSESQLRETLSSCLGRFRCRLWPWFKSDWFAELSPSSNVIGIDISESLILAKETINAKIFVFKMRPLTTQNPDSFDYIVCDQVIMHTDNPLHS